MARELVVSFLQGGMSAARWAAGQTKSSVQQGRASGTRCQGRSAWRGAALWGVELSCLSSGLEPASVTPSKCCTPPFWVFLISVLAPLVPNVEFSQESIGDTWLFCFIPVLASMDFPQEPVYGWSCSAEMLVLQIC